MNYESMIKTDEQARQTAIENGYDGLDILVMGQFSVREYVPESPNEVCISIVSEQWGIDKGLKYILESKFKDVLTLEFDDVLTANTGESVKTITLTQAKQIVNFVKKWHQHPVSRIVVHCFAGVNRSRSVASALCTALNLPFTYTANNPHIRDTILSKFNWSDG